MRGLALFYVLQADRRLPTEERILPIRKREPGKLTWRERRRFYRELRQFMAVHDGS